MRVIRSSFVLVLSASLAQVGACGDGEEGGASPPHADSGAPDQDAGLDEGPFGDRAKVTEALSLSGLSAPANAVRDKHGWVHIYARSLEDAFRVQGFMMASDRMGQLELLRRLATGRLAELFGAADPASIDSDIAMRTVGLGRTAKAIHDALEPGGEAKRVLEAFAAGITAWIRGYREGKLAIPQELAGMTPDDFTDWSAVDSLAIARYQLFSLSYTAGDEIRRSAQVQQVRAKFKPDASDALAQKRANTLIDVFRFADLESVAPMLGFPTAPFPPEQVSPSGVPAAKLPKVPASTFASASGFATALRRAQDWLGSPHGAGSNDWAVAGSKTASGHALLANDPHLALSSPTIFWPVHIVVQPEDGAPAELELAGVSVAGVPGISSGTNRHVAFGNTTAWYDVTDVWQETLSADSTGVSFKGQKVGFQKISETIKIAGKPDYTWDVLVVPHHGPVVPTLKDHQVLAPSAGQPVLSVRWTGHEPTKELLAVLNLARAKAVAEAELALRNWEVGAQSWALADSKGSIGLTTHAKLPYRDKKAYTWDPKTFSGTLPCFVLDGASGDHEWTGAFLEEDFIPKVSNPQEGWLASANSDPIGALDDNDPSNDLLPNGKPFFIGATFRPAARLKRVHERLSAVAGKATAAHMSEIQADHQSYWGRRLSGFLVTALEAAEAEKLGPGTHPELAAVVTQDARYSAANVPDLIATLKQWGADADYDAPAGLSYEDGAFDPDPVRAMASKATLIFNAWLVRAQARALYDELDAAGLGDDAAAGKPLVDPFGWLAHLLATTPAELATYDAATGQSALWDDMSTPKIESRNEQLVTALLDAVDDLNALVGVDRTKWRWGELHRVRSKSMVPFWLIDVPAPSDPIFGKGFPRPADHSSIDVADYRAWIPRSEPLDFSNSFGAVVRLVVELDPAGPKIQAVMPGGSVLSRESPYFANETELWRRNQTHDVPFEIDDVQAAIPAGGQHVLFTP